MKPRVIILGGGIAGLSAAHELIERGFEVEVYERLAIPGGKSRSTPVPGTATAGPRGMRKPLPGEHGFRFFPRFYRHVIDTMRRIPLGQGRCVADNLVDTTRIRLTRFGAEAIDLPTRYPRNFGDIKIVLKDIPQILDGDLGLSHDDIAFFASRVWRIVTSCRERRMTEYEQIGWWDFIGAEERSPAYQALLGHGFTRSLVAAKANRASTKTVGDMFVQLQFDIITPGPSTDRVLNGPTNDVWINPWVEYLAARGVRYERNAKATAVAFADGRIQGVTIARPSGAVKVTGDAYIFAVPVEDIIDLITPAMIDAEPALDNLSELDDITEWMNGIQLYLREDVKLVHGHVIHVDSPWAITSISQAQFWKDFDWSDYGDGQARGVISVDISDWERPGLNGKAAKDCTPEEVMREVWEQLKLSFNVSGSVVLKDDNLHKWSLDPSLTLRSNGPDLNEEPLLVNLVNTWRLRPEACTRIPNMFLAADYVRTHTDLATMEGANEAARRAVNGILDAYAPQHPRCQIWALHEPELFAPWRAIDRLRFERGLPWDDSAIDVGLAALDAVQTIADKVEKALGQYRTGGSSPGGIEGITSHFADSPAQGESTQVASSKNGSARILLERIVQQLTLRVAEAQLLSSSQSLGSMPSTVRPASGRVRIIP